MRILQHSALLVVLLPLPPLASSWGEVNSAARLPIADGRFSRASNVIQDREVIGRSAEEMVVRAAALRQEQTSQSLNEAISLLRQSVSMFQAAGLSSQAADAWIQIGEMYFITSRFKSASGAFSQALALAQNDREQRVRALSHMARTSASKGSQSEANDYSTQALSLIQGLSPGIQAEALEARGEYFFWTDDYIQALDLFRRARDLFAQTGNQDGQALALLMMAQAVHLNNRLESLALAKQAFELWSSSGNHYGIALVRVFLSTLSALAGQFETSHCNAIQARDTLHEVGNKDDAAAALNNLGFASFETGEPEASLNFYREARNSFLSIQEPLGEATAISGMGRAYLALRNNVSALKSYQAKLHLARQVGDRSIEASALTDIADLRALNGSSQKADALYHQALALFHQAHNPLGEGRVLIGLGRLSTAGKKYADAISFFALARPLKEGAGQVQEVAKIDYELAVAYRGLGQLQDSLEAIEKTIKLIESQRLKITDFDSRASYFASIHKYYALYIQLLMMAYRQDPQHHSVAEAFEASEKSKARSLLDWLAGTRQETSCDELLKKQWEENGAEPPPDFSSVKPASVLKQVQSEIGGDDALLLEYVLGDEESYLWVVDEDKTTWYQLPPVKHINDLVQGFREAVTAPQKREGEKNIDFQKRTERAAQLYPRYASQLSRLLLGQVHLGTAKRVIIVPEGPLQYIPFAALSSFDEAGHRALLAANHDVIILPSASALGALRKSAANRSQPSLGAAVFADPVYGPDDSRVSARNHAPAPPPSQVSRAWNGDLGHAGHPPPIPASHKEAEAVEGFDKNAMVREGFLASREAVLNPSLGIYRWLHFAVHGVLDERHPERSGLILALMDKHGSPRNGFLSLNDVYGMKLSADLVVLSACDSGLGKDLSSEGIIGLPRAFLRAGARSVIATLWEVDDAATAELMRDFYESLRHGLTPVSALRHAQMRLSHSGKWPDAYYWAAFVFQGDYR